MKRLCFLGLMLFFVSPFSALAQTGVPYARYCPDPAQVFIGIDHETEYTPKITVKVDPAFNAKMKQERNTPDLPVTPVYDLVVTVMPTINEYCLPQYDENGTLTKKVDPPEKLPFPGHIILGESFNPSNVVVGPGQFTRIWKNERGEWEYEWKIKGWPNGITTGDKMEKLINAISTKQQPVNVLVEVPQKDGTKITEKSGVPFDLCAPIWGNGRYSITGRRSSHTFQNFSFFMQRFENDRSAGFASVEPYASEQSYFRYLIDLQQYIIPLSFNLSQKVKISDLLSGSDALQINDIISKQSSCVRDGYSLTYIEGLNSLGVVNFSIVAGKSSSVMLVGIKETNPHIAVHEFSHVFASIEDEYIYAPDSSQEKRGVIRGVNCTTSPISNYTFQSRLYGGDKKYIGCTVMVMDGEKVYRPSQTSIMRNSDQSNFNVVSCGYILSAIHEFDTNPQGFKKWDKLNDYYYDKNEKRANAQSYFPECAKMDGVIKDGVQASAFYPFFAWLDNTLNRSSASSQTAAVGNSDNSSDNKSYLIVESFDPNNPWGTIIEVVPDSQIAVTSQTPSVQQPPVSGIGEVTDESIFDTVSVDLKVNGQDGPIEVEKRARIVLSWISEGATRCRGVWSKNDIKLSGTAAGRITRDAVIKIACINADGERADDAVRVNIVDEQHS